HVLRTRFRARRAQVFPAAISRSAPLGRHDRVSQSREQLPPAGGTDGGGLDPEVDGAQGLRSAVGPAAPLEVWGLRRTNRASLVLVACASAELKPRLSTRGLLSPVRAARADA